MFEEALHKAKTEWAAILIQRYYRARKRRKDEVFSTLMGSFYDVKGSNSDPIFFRVWTQIF